MASALGLGTVPLPLRPYEEACDHYEQALRFASQGGRMLICRARGSLQTARYPYAAASACDVAPRLGHELMPPNRKAKTRVPPMRVQG